MLEKLGIPENCIKNLDIPLTKIFTDEEIEKYKIQECKLFASINSDLLNIQKSEKNDSRYDEIHFVYIKISALSFSSDLYRFVKNIYKMIKYQVIVIIQLNDMYKIGGSCIAPGKIDQEENIIKHFIFTEWIYEDFETKQIKQFFEEFAREIKKASTVDKLYSMMYTKISSVDNSIDTKNIKPVTITRMLKKILPLDCTKRVTKEILENTFTYKIYVHYDDDYKVDENNALRVYPIECFWHSLNKNEVTKTILEKRRVFSYEDLFWNNYFDEDYE